MDQGVKEVPNEEDAELGSCRLVEDTKRDSIRCDENRESCEEGKDGGTINYQRR